MRRTADTVSLIGDPRVLGYGLDLEDTPAGRELLRKALILAGNTPDEAKRLADTVPFYAGK